MIAHYTGCLIREPRKSTPRAVVAPADPQNAKISIDLRWVMPSSTPARPQLHVVPAHHLPAAERAELGVRRGRGRPRQIAVAPSSDDYAAVLDEQRREHVESDPLVQRGADDIEALAVLREVAIGVAVESAAVGWERQQAEREGRDASKLCSRRIDALMKLAQLVLELHARRDDELRPDVLAAVRESFVGVAREAADDTLGVGADSFIARLEAAISR